MKGKRMRKGLSLLLMAALLLVLVPAAAFAEPPAAPTANVEPGNVVRGTVVTFSTATAEASLTYRLDDEEIWTAVTGPIVIDQSMTIQVKAEKDGEHSETTFTYSTRNPNIEITGVTGPDPVEVGVEATLTATIRNNEDRPATITTLYYTFEDTNYTVSVGTDIPAGGEISVPFKHTFTSDRLAEFVLHASVGFVPLNATAALSPVPAISHKVSLDVVNPDADYTATIAEVRAACPADESETGKRFIIVGTLTTNGYTYDDVSSVTDCKAFENCVYIQDATGGICCTGISTGNLVGEQVKVTGHTAYVNGEPVLAATSISLVAAATEESMAAITPAASTPAASLNDRSSEGKLIKLEGTVVSVESSGGKISKIMIKDSANNTARVLIDSYITTGTEIANCVAGATVTVTGIASYNKWDTENPAFIRVRDRADMVCTAPVAVKPATPTADVASGSEVDSGTTVTFATTTEGATLSFSTDDGTNWTTGSSITVNAATTVKVKATKDSTDSDIAEFSYTVKAAPVKPATPTASVASESEVDSGTSITFSCATEGATIQISLDGTTWTTGSTIVTDEDVTVYVKAVLGTEESEVATFTYTIKAPTPEKPATPTASVASNSEVDSGTTVTFATTTEGAAIQISLDGSTWTTASSITVNAATTVKVKAVKASVESDEATFIYTIKADPTAPAKPTITPMGGEAELGTAVTFACATEGATISYRFSDNDEWTVGNSFVLETDCTVQFKAVKDELTTMGDPVSFKTYVLLNANGGTVSETRVYTPDGSLPALPLPSQRDGYIFGGWFDSETGGSQLIQGESPAVKTTLYAHWYELSSSVREGAAVPAALTGTYASVDAMRNTMLKTVQRRLGTTAVKGSKLYEVSVQYYDSDLGTWLPILASQFPTAGVKVAIGIPSGAAGTDRFVALHLFGEDCNGHKAGEGEMPTITVNGGNLNLTVHGTSPLLLVWTATGSGSGTTPRTGDESNLAVWGGMMIASFTAMLAAPVILRRKKA